MTTNELSSINTLHRCRTCGGTIYMSGIRDHVGRQTSKWEWLHYEQPTDGHPIAPPFLPNDGAE